MIGNKNNNFLFSIIILLLFNITKKERKKQKRESEGKNEATLIFFFKLNRSRISKQTMRPKKDLINFAPIYLSPNFLNASKYTYLIYICFLQGGQ